jgi:hypothetical protein
MTAADAFVIIVIDLNHQFADARSPAVAAAKRREGPFAPATKVHGVTSRRPTACGGKASRAGPNEAEGASAMNVTQTRYASYLIRLRRAAAPPYQNRLIGVGGAAEQASIRTISVAYSTN